MPGTQGSTFASRVEAGWQYVVVGLLALITGATIIASLRRLAAPTAPVALFWATVGVGLFVILLHWPAVFRRLPVILRLAAYLGIAGYFAQVIVTTELMANAWRKTPAGAREYAEMERSAAEHAAYEAQQAAARDKQQQIERKRSDLQTSVAEYSAQVERCFNWRGRLPALEDAVKDALHDPASFEHVETAVILPDSENNDVRMTFRAKNGFGAVRTLGVVAFIVPDICEVRSIAEPQEL